MKTPMPLPNWDHYRVVPESVLEDAVRDFYRDSRWNAFVFDITDYAQRLVRRARPNMSAEQIENFLIDQSIAVACEPNTI